jgi:FkbM family methyltransferase
MSIDGHLLCVEANPNLVPSLTERLHRHRKSQRIDVLQAAIAYDVDEVEFAIESENTAGRISPGSGVTVPAIEFGELITKFRIVGAYALVCDIEGAELMLVERDRSSLAKCELVVIELHESVDQLGRRVSVDQLRAKFVEIGFTMIEAHGPVCCLRRPVIDPNSPQTA